MRKGLLAVFLLLLLGGGVFAYVYYQKLFSAVVKSDETLYIQSDTSYEQLVEMLKKEGIIENESNFNLAAKLTRYNKKVKGGKYQIEAGWSLIDLARKFRSGTVETVKVSFHNIRHLEKLAGLAAQQIEADSLAIIKALREPNIYLEDKIETHIFCHIIPNTYEFYWATSAGEFVQRIVKEADKFWTDQRLSKANKLNLSRCEVVNLAAIVQEEQSLHVSEQDRIAGLYLNRLQRGMLLQADPTLKYAAGDFSIKRLLNYHKKIDSPYNTYKYAGLPPTPIVVPEPQAIDAVLNHENHDFIYMCAKEDFSGYHNFARTLRQHNINAAKYQRALSREMRKAANSL